MRALGLHSRRTSLYTWTSSQSSLYIMLRTSPIEHPLFANEISGSAAMGPIGGVMDVVDAL